MATSPQRTDEYQVDNLLRRSNKSEHKKFKDALARTGGEALVLFFVGGREFEHV